MDNDINFNIVKVRSKFHVKVLRDYDKIKERVLKLVTYHALRVNQDKLNLSQEPLMNSLHQASFIQLTNVFFDCRDGRYEPVRRFVEE